PGDAAEQRRKGVLVDSEIIERPGVAIGQQFINDIVVVALRLTELLVEPGLRTQGFDVPDCREIRTEGGSRRKPRCLKEFWGGGVRRYRDRYPKDQ
ncbi:MAG: hypothetical protein AAGL66_17300, partial [Pseudomonadota bacterium]